MALHSPCCKALYELPNVYILLSGKGSMFNLGYPRKLRLFRGKFLEMLRGVKLNQNALWG